MQTFPIRDPQGQPDQYRGDPAGQFSTSMQQTQHGARLHHPRREELVLGRIANQRWNRAWRETADRRLVSFVPSPAALHASRNSTPASTAGQIRQAALHIICWAQLVRPDPGVQAALRRLQHCPAKQRWKIATTFRTLLTPGFHGAVLHWRRPRRRSSPAPGRLTFRPRDLAHTPAR